jgi:hypothetical protein
MGSHFAGAGVLVGLALWIAVGPAVVAIAGRFPIRRDRWRALLVLVPVGVCTTLFKTSFDFLIGQALDVPDDLRRLGLAGNALVYTLLVLATRFLKRGADRSQKTSTDEAVEQAARSPEEPLH